MTDPEGTVRWRELLAEAVDRLSASGPTDARAEARHLVAEAAGAEGPADLLVVLDERATERAVARFDDMLARRCAGEPLQYVLGRWGFRGLDLMVDRRVLIPRPETESVVEVALAELDRSGGRGRPTIVADLGTGSGAIALSVAAERVRASVWATDASAAALEVAQANVAGVGRAGARVRLVHGSWFEPLPAELRGRIDLVVSNPPYVAEGAPLPPEVGEWEPPGALFAGPDGTDALVHLVDSAPEWLAPGGVLVLELSPEQGPALADAAAGRFAEVELARDLAGRTRALVARRPR